MIEELEYKEFKIQIHQDELGESPREWDNFSKLALFHNHYNLPNEDNLAVEDAIDILNDPDYFAMLIWGYDHSMLAIKTGARVYPFNCPWDSGQLGIVYVSKNDVRREYSVKRISAKAQEKAFSLMRSEVEIYNYYLTGQVYFYWIVDPDGNELDSCGGFYGQEWRENGLLEYAENSIDYHAKEYQAEQLELELGQVGVM